MTDSLVCDTETNSDYLDNTVDIVQKTLTSRDLTGHVHIDSQLLSKFFSSFQVVIRVIVPGKRESRGTGLGLGILVEYVFPADQSLVIWLRKF